MEKCKTLFLVLFLIALMVVQGVFAITKEEKLPLTGKIIFVDAGHGGRDPGTNYGKILEKDLNLEIAFAVGKELEKQGATVYQTREEDKDYSSKWDPKKKRGDLYRRIEMMREKKTDLYLSIHINWYQNASYYGAEVLYGNVNKENRILAESLMKEFQKELSSPREVKQTDLYLYNNTTIPGVLVECGFLSNLKERKLLQDPNYHKTLGEVMTKGVIRYFTKLESSN